MAIFVIADTHFGHKWCAAARGFANSQDHDEALIENWNWIITKRDIVWHLGDAVFGLPAFDCLARLNGNKRLVMGNHDQYPLARYAEHFTAVRGSIQIKGGILTHIPINQSQLVRFKFNIHGHLHSEKIKDSRYICVSCEQINFTPQPLEEIIDALRAAY